MSKMQNKQILVSEAVLQRLSGKTPPKCTEDDNYYYKKLADMDMEHTQKMGLTEENFWKTLSEVEGHLGLSQLLSCVQDRSYLATCYRENSSSPLLCAENLEQFTECLHNATAAQLRKKSETTAE